MSLQIQTSLLGLFFTVTCLKVLTTHAIVHYSMLNYKATHSLTHSLINYILTVTV